MADMSAIAPCRIGQVAPGFATVPGAPAPRIVPTGVPGSGYNAPGGLSTLTPGGEYAVLDLGAAPSITMYGVTANTLVQYDVLRINGLTAPAVQAENVENLQVLYGVDDGIGGIANDNVVDRWVVPGSAGFELSTMLSGGPGVLQVKAIRIALVVRAAEPAQTQGADEVVMFPELSTALQVRVPVPAADRRFARQVVDLVIPLRNQWISLCSEERRAAGLPAPGACG